MKPIAYRHGSRIGTFTIRLRPDNTWQIWHADENLGGRYALPQQAVDDLTGGHTDWPGNTDPSTLELSDDLGDWHPDFSR